MFRRFIRKRPKCIVLDINTQKDFFLAWGSMCVRNHRRVLAHIRRLIAWARKKNIPVISLCEIYPQNNGSTVAAYCIDNTEGVKKIHYTLLPQRISFAADNNANLPAELIKGYKQLILHKRCSDPFEEPRIERLLTEIKAEEFILIGAAAETAVKAAALGLLQRGKKVRIVIDAVGTLNKNEGELAMRKTEAKGAKLITTKKLAGRSHLKRIGICNCPACRSRNINKHSLGLAAGL